MVRVAVVRVVVVRVAVAKVAVMRVAVVRMTIVRVALVKVVVVRKAVVSEAVESVFGDVRVLVVKDAADMGNKPYHSTELQGHLVFSDSLNRMRCVSRQGVQANRS